MNWYTLRKHYILALLKQFGSTQLSHYELILSQNFESISSIRTQKEWESVLLATTASTSILSL